MKENRMEKTGHDTCEGCRHFGREVTEEPCFSCEKAHVLYDNYEPMTNMDRIRGMSGHELAEFLVGVSDGVTEFTVCGEDCGMCENHAGMCEEMVVRWLKETAG